MPNPTYPYALTDEELAHHKEVADSKNGGAMMTIRAWELSWIILELQERRAKDV